MEDSDVLFPFMFIPIPSYFLVLGNFNSSNKYALIFSQLPCTLLQQHANQFN